ncbi:hypothetical protein B5G37_10610 [Pseudoflavonifractor sp. An85]|nr:hypothetical protein B5G37_10610 [Pseudoflavonifractor sp. An85]
MPGQRQALTHPRRRKVKFAPLGRETRGQKRGLKRSKEKQEKITTLLVRRVGHNCPQCGQFQAFQRAFLWAKSSERNALLGTSLTVPRNSR